METEEQFKRFCRVIGLRLEPWQDLLIAEFFSGRREVVFLLPRGCGKMTLLGALALFELLRDPNAAIVCAAASREQASHLFNTARRFALATDAIRGAISITRRELRTPTEGRLLVISADAEKQLGWDPSLILFDELGSVPDDSLYTSLRTALVKRRDSRQRVISTAGSSEESVLGKLRARCLTQPHVAIDGALTVARGDDLALVEYRLPDDWPLERLAEVSPASWITREAIAEQLASSVPEPKIRRLHGNQWVAADEAFITADEWDRNAGRPEFPDGCAELIAVDASIRHDATAVVEVRRVGDIFHAGWRIWHPERGHEIQIAEVEAHVRELTKRYRVEPVIFDERYFNHAAQRLDDEGAPMVVWSYRQMASATQTLREIVVNGRLRHGGDPVARRHALAAKVVEREYGEIISKRRTREPNDALVSLAMAVEHAAGWSAK